MDRRRRLWLAGGLAVLVALGAIFTAYMVSRSGAGPAAGPTSSNASAGATASTPAAETPTVPPPPPPPPAPPQIPELPPGSMNILVIGSDSRGNAREQAAHTLETGESSDHRSDSLMLVHVPADRRQIYGISIMRDMWVDIPGYGASKINSSLEVGGIPLVVRSVESLLGAHIDRTLMLDFNGFRTITNALGGIDVNVTLPFTATFETHHEFAAGVNHLDGQAALEFVRERYAFIDGDYQRVRNQQTFLRALMVKLSSSLRDPASVLGLVTLTAPYLTVDQGFDPAAVATLAYSLRSVDPGAAVFFTLPTAGVGTTAGGASIVLPDYAGIGAVGAALREGRLPEYVAANGL